MRLMIATVAAALLIGCGGGSPTAPSAAAPAPASSTGVPFTLVLQTNGLGVAFRVTLNSQTYTANGLFQQQLSPGTYTLSGSFTPTGQGGGEGLILVFQRGFTGSGGVRSGSVRSLGGPALTAGQCSVGYAVLDATRTPQNFQVQFEVTTDQNSSCQFGA